MGAKGKPSKAELRNNQKQDRTDRRKDKEMKASMHQLKRYTGGWF